MAVDIARDMVVLERSSARVTGEYMRPATTIGRVFDDKVVRIEGIEDGAIICGG